MPDLIAIRTLSCLIHELSQAVEDKHDDTETPNVRPHVFDIQEFELRNGGSRWPAWLHVSQWTSRRQSQHIYRFTGVGITQEALSPQEGSATRISWKC